MEETVEKYEVVINGESVKVANLKEAEEKIKRIEYNDFDVSYIVKKIYTKSGKLLEEIMVG